MKLLIADDEKIIRQGLEQLDWKSIGITEVMTADNGLEALKIISSFHPNIILTDIRMPGLDGLQLAKELSEHKMDCKLIILSGYGTFEYARQAIASGVFEYLLKPSNPSEILDAVFRGKRELECTLLSKYRDNLKQESEEIFLTEEVSTSKIILNYLEEHYMEDISLTSLAEYTHFSPTYLSRLIKKNTSYNFTKLLGLMRMLKAAELLSATELKIYVICEKIGINDQRYFSQLFRKTFGKTPAEYRKASSSKCDGNLMDFIEQFN